MYRRTRDRKTALRGRLRLRRRHEPPWTVGDNVNLAVGQGDFLATPLQLAVAYAAIENGGTVVRPHVGLQITDPDGRVLQQIEPQAGAPRRHPADRPAGDPRRPARRRAGAGRHLGRRVRAASRKPVYGKTGTAQHRQSATSPGTSPTCPTRSDRSSSPRPSSRAASAPRPPRPAVRLILSQWFGVRREIVSGTSQHADEHATPDPAAASTRSRAAAARGLLLDPWLLLATLGLIACSLVTIKGATRNDIPGSPLYFFERQLGYAIVGLLLMLLLTRFDYSRLREFKLPIYGAADRLERARAGARLGRARLAPLDRPAVLPVPAVRARQAAADRRAVGVRRRPLAPARRARDDRAADAARARSGRARDDPAGPRLRARLRDGRAGHPLRRRHARPPARRPGGVVRRRDGARARRPLRRSACTCSSRIRWSVSRAS